MDFYSKIIRIKVLYFFIHEKLEMKSKLRSWPYNFVGLTGYIYFLDNKSTLIGLI